MCLFRKQYNPDLIDLERYEGQISKQRRKGSIIMPPPTIPGVMRGWSDAEMQSMKINRRKARKLYKRFNDAR
jgi:hypothetical protein